MRNIIIFLKHILLFLIFQLLFLDVFSQKFNNEFLNSESSSQYPCHKREDQYNWNNNNWLYYRTFFRTFDSLYLLREVVDTVNNVKLYNDSLFFFSGNYGGYTQYHCPWNGAQFQYQTMDILIQDTIGRLILNSSSNWNGNNWTLSNKDTVILIFAGSNLVSDERFTYTSGNWVF